MSGEKRDCQHPIAHHEHGTQLAYIRDRCRCEPCCAANTARENRRARLKAYGRYNGLVDAEPVRQHIRTLSEHGVGMKTITRLTGVSGGQLSSLVYGRPLPDGSRRPPQRRCSPSVRDRILAVPLDAHADRAHVPSHGTHRRLQALVFNGWSQCQLAAWLGMARANFGKTMQSEHVYASTARAVVALYEQLWDKPPPEHSHREKIAASRARRHAREHGWLPALAWDDESIDDPQAEPATTTDEPIGLDEIAVERIMAGTLRLPSYAQSPELLEAVARLAARGLTDRQIGQRIGRGRDTVLKLRERHGIPTGVAA